MCILVSVIDYVYIVHISTGVTGVTTMQIKIACFVFNILCSKSDVVLLLSFSDSTSYYSTGIHYYYNGVQELKINAFYVNIRLLKMNGIHFFYKNQ